MATAQEIKLAKTYVAASKAMADYLENDGESISDERTDELCDAEMDAEVAIVDFLIKKGHVKGEDAAALRFASETVAKTFAQKALA